MKKRGGGRKYLKIVSLKYGRVKGCTVREKENVEERVRRKKDLGRRKRASE